MSVIPPGSIELAGKLFASADVELLKDVPEVCFHRPLCDEETFSDLTVCPPFGREACHAKLAGGQRLDTGEDRLAGTPAGGEEFLAGARRERGRARSMCQLETLPEMVSGLDAMTLAAKRRSQLEESAGELEPSGGLPEQTDRLAQQRDAFCPWRNGAGHPGCRAERARQARRSRELELLGREASSLVLLA